MNAPSKERLFLRADTNIELLRCRWYAWQHTISPVQHAMNLAFRQIPLMESFLDEPEVHIDASAQPELLGGPYVDLPIERLGEVREILDAIRSNCQNFLQLAEDIRELVLKVADEGKGASLDHLYAELPDSLRGVVEFVYDSSGAPLVRLREELMMKDDRYACSMQEVALTRTADHNRNFFINTPKVVAEGDIFMRLPIDSPLISMLSDARINAVDLDELSEDLCVSTESLRPFFTADRPLRASPEFKGDGVRIRYYGHASVAIQSAETTILIDPRYAFERTDDLARFTFLDLPDVIDYVFISHAHQDHFCAETLCQLRHRTRNVLVPRNSRGSLCDPSMKLTLSLMGFSSVQAMDDLDIVRVPDGYIQSIPFPGEHGGLDILSKQCALVELSGFRFLFLVDSDAVDMALYERLIPHIGKLDAVFIGMECDGAPVSWLYGPVMARPVSRPHDVTRRGNGSDCSKAWKVIEALDCAQVYVYAMGMEPWNDHLLGLEYGEDSIQILESNALVERCRTAGMRAERLKGCREFAFSR